MHKLKDRRGETLVETLASLLIAAIAMLMFAEILSAAASVTKTGRNWNEDINPFNTFLEKRDPASIPERAFVKDGEITITGLIENADVKFFVAPYGGEGIGSVISYVDVSS